jgi:hypothetical protein
MELLGVQRLVRIVGWWLREELKGIWKLIPSQYMTRGTAEYHKNLPVEQVSGPKFESRIISIENSCASNWNTLSVMYEWPKQVHHLYANKNVCLHTYMHLCVNYDKQRCY